MDRNTVAAELAEYAKVALRLECVDRNSENIRLCNYTCIVALRLECVDRNREKNKKEKFLNVALRLECVDRNLAISSSLVLLVASHSVWSAWIEITLLDTLIISTPCRTPFGVRG